MYVLNKQTNEELARVSANLDETAGQPCQLTGKKSG